MTSGTKHYDTGEVTPLGYYQYPQGWWFPGGSVVAGRRYDKTWSGGDRPKQKREYEYLYLTIPERYIVKKRWNKRLKVWEKVRKLVPAKVIKRKFRKSPLETIRRLPDQPHPYTATISEYVTRPVYAVTRYEYGSLSTLSYIDAGASSGFSNTMDWTSNDDLKLIGKLRERIAGSDFNLAVTLGEGREALEMIANSAIRIRKAITAVRRFDLPGALKHLAQTRPPQKWMKRDSKNAVSNNWLELQYGWLPLLSDAENAAQFLAKSLSEPYVQRYRARRQLAHRLVKSAPSYTYDMSQCYYLTRGQIVAYVEEVDVPQLLGLLDPLTLGWELLPYSFVIDWFLPIGDYLSARGLASSVKATYVTSKATRIQGVYKPTPVKNAVVSESIKPDGYVRYRQTSMTRTVSTSLNIPVPSVKGFGEAMSWKRCANAVALLLNLSR